MQHLQGDFILLNSARECLLDHSAVEMGLDNRGHWPAGSAPRYIDEDTRKMILDACRDNAQDCLTRAIESSNIRVWCKGVDGEMSIAAARWAADCFEGKDDLNARDLYFRTIDWLPLLAALTSDMSRKYFATITDEVGQSSVLERTVEHKPSVEKVGELPIWLNPYQLVAWVQYRDLHVVSKVSDWTSLAAKHWYAGAPRIGSVVEVKRALAEGRLVGQGYKNGDLFVPIPAVEWSRIDLAPLELSRQHPYVQIQFDRRDVLALFPVIGTESFSSDRVHADTEARAARAPAVKAGRPPSDDEILLKADEMKSRGFNGQAIAKNMRLEPGFEDVSNTLVRDLIKGRWKQSGRPKKMRT